MTQETLAIKKTRKPRTANIAAGNLQRQLETMGWSISHDANNDANNIRTTMTGNITAYTAYIQSAQAGILNFANADNAEHSKGRFKEIGAFHGVKTDTLERNLLGDMDLTAYQAAFEKIAKRGLSEKIEAKIGEIMPRRKRIMSEHDGDWSYDRQWEISPFDATRRAACQGKTITLIVNFAVSCMTDHAALENFGCFAWAICSLIESAGVGVNLVVRFQASDLSTSRSGDCDIQITIKKSDQYVEPTRIAAMLQTAAYRRGIFSFYAAVCDVTPGTPTVGDHCGSYPKSFAPIKNTAPGVLEIAPDVRRAIDETIEKEILATIAGSDFSEVAVAS